MRGFYIDKDWNFKDTVEHIKALRNDYDRILASFSYFKLHEKVEFIRKTRNDFYSLNCKEWESNKLWEYMNHYERFYVLQQIVERNNRR